MTPCSPLKVKYVSEVNVAFIFVFEEYAKQETSKKEVTSRKNI
jgi:hypothetical protein